MSSSGRTVSKLSFCIRTFIAISHKLTALTNISLSGFLITSNALFDKFPVFASVHKKTCVSNKSTYPDASVGVCCSHKVVAVGFNTLRYDASVGVLNPPHE